jgi:hypothetical protein
MIKMNVLRIISLFLSVELCFIEQYDTRAY